MKLVPYMPLGHYGRLCQSDAGLLGNPRTSLREEAIAVRSISRDSLETRRLHDA